MTQETKTQQLKVIVVDDSNTVRSSAQNILTEMGHDVALAENGYDALSLIVDMKPDIIFLDIMMPKLDGYQTCALIKHNLDYKDIPIIMLSSKDGVYDKAKAKVVGANDFISKPFNAEDLMSAIDKSI